MFLSLSLFLLLLIADDLVIGQLRNVRGMRTIRWIPERVNKTEMRIFRIELSQTRVKKRANSRRSTLATRSREKKKVCPR